MMKFIVTVAIMFISFIVFNPLTIAYTYSKIMKDESSYLILLHPYGHIAEIFINIIILSLVLYFYTL